MAFDDIGETFARTSCVEHPPCKPFFEQREIAGEVEIDNHARIQRDIRGSKPMQMPFPFAIPASSS
jgi:hypothetical protein